ncbi:MAG TPA: hypothetical protein VFK05_07310 [Polyangiaceae bacterium]|nr:hypothetical protein [Polyangiaceae bacterium]
MSTSARRLREHSQRLCDVEFTHGCHEYPCRSGQVGAPMRRRRLTLGQKYARCLRLAPREQAQNTQGMIEATTPIDEHQTGFGCTPKLRWQRYYPRMVI